MGEYILIATLPPDLQEQAMRVTRERTQERTPQPEPSRDTLWCGHPSADVAPDDGVEWCPHCDA